MESAILRAAFHIRVESGSRTVSIPKFNNSWKGLLFFLLSILHMRHGKKITTLTASVANACLFASDDYNHAYECREYFGNEIEILPKMPGYNRCFVVCRTNPDKMSIALEGLIQILQIDNKKSKITMEALKTGGHNYKSKIVDFPQFTPTPRIVDDVFKELTSPPEYIRSLDEAHYNLEKREHERRLLEYLNDTNL